MNFDHAVAVAEAAYFPALAAAPPYDGDGGDADADAHVDDGGDVGVAFRCVGVNAAAWMGRAFQNNAPGGLFGVHDDKVALSPDHPLDQIGGQDGHAHLHYSSSITWYW